MDVLFVKFSVSVSRDKWHSYNEIGEAMIEIAVPTNMLAGGLETGNIMKTLLPVALATLPLEKETEDDE